VAAVDGVNRTRPVGYGFFAPSAAPAVRHRFLDRTAWCLVSDARGPCGFAYTYDLGEAGGRPVVHAGLVKFSRRLGRDVFHAVYVVLLSVELAHRGPFVATSVTHLPAIADTFARGISNVYPSPDGSVGLREQYLPALRLLRDEYVVPVLGLPPGAVCERTYRLVGSLAAPGPGFETDWRTAARHSPESAASFLADRLPDDRGPAVAVRGGVELDGGVEMDQDV
jgi:hypothetical protein